jgi:hypothetical protein
MDNEGKGEEICSKNFGANEDLDLLNWLPSRFLEMCILAGCDYLESLPGIAAILLGLKVTLQGSLTLTHPQV